MRRPSTFVLITAIFGLIVLLGYWFLLLPQIRQMASDRQQINLLNQDRSQNPADKSLIDKQKLLETRQTASDLLPISDNQYDLSVQIEALCKGVGANLTALSFSKAPADSKATNTALGKLIFSLSINADYTTTQKVVAGLTTLDRFITIDQLNMTLQSSSSASAAAGSTPVPGGRLATQITGFAYYLPVVSNPSP